MSPTRTITYETNKRLCFRQFQATFNWILCPVVMIILEFAQTIWVGPSIDANHVTTESVWCQKRSSISIESLGPKAASKLNLNSVHWARLRNVTQCPLPGWTFRWHWLDSTHLTQPAWELDIVPRLQRNSMRCQEQNKITCQVYVRLALGYKVWLGNIELTCILLVCAYVVWQINLA